LSSVLSQHASKSMLENGFPMAPSRLARDSIFPRFLSRQGFPGHIVQRTGRTENNAYSWTFQFSSLSFIQPLRNCLVGLLTCLVIKRVWVVMTPSPSSLGRST
jgi:hypothetical protein